MTSKWETTVGQLRLVNGVRVESPVNLSVLDRHGILPVGRRGKGSLYVLLELSGGSFGREELCEDLVSAITEEYTHTPGTVTYGLRQAVLLANAQLVQTNARVANEHRVGGVACVVLRDGEVFIAQAGWPMVYLIHQERVEAFPDTTLEDEDTTTLGHRQTVEVRLFRSSIRAGDTILMVDGPMSRQLGITRIGQVISGGVEQATRNLETLAPPEDCSAMVIQVGSSPRAEVQAEQWVFAPVEPPSFADVEVAEEPPPDLSPIPPEPADEAPSPEEEIPVYEPPREEPESTGPAVSERMGAILGVIAGGLRTLGQRMLPDRRPQPSPSERRRRTARARRGRGQDARQTHWGIAMAIGIPIVALLFVVGYVAYRNWSLQSQFDAYLKQAKLERDIALSSAQSPGIARDYWVEVLDNVGSAAGLKPDHPELFPLRVQALAEIDRIDGVTRLGQIHKLYEYTMVGSSPSRVVVAGLDVYVLDQGVGRVYHHALNEMRNGLRDSTADQVLIQQGQPVQGQVVGRPIDIAWIQDGGERQAGALLILDHNGLLLEYDPAWEQLTNQLVGGKDSWRSPIALSTYDSNLYVLDPIANQVFKYRDREYTNAPERWIKQSDANLTTAVDMGIDGNIYVLHSDGKLVGYYGGEHTAFALTGTPKPLSSAAALYLDMEEVAQYIYVVDASGKRIVQYDREGAFIRQLQPILGQEASFGFLASVFVDETGGKLYYVGANALYVTDIPPVAH